ncbi:hypothetical protein Tco_0266060 [Tanacetum coccineum]
MNTTQAQQKALDDDFVAPADHLEFEKCNMRLNTYIKPKEATFQVVLDALALTSFYRAFLITADEDLLFQIENKDAKKTNKMSYPRFKKIIIDYFMSKDQSILKRNKMFWHIARDATMFTSIRCISRHEDTQVEKAPKLKYTQKKADSDTSPKKKLVQATKGTRLKSKAKVVKPDKKKQPAKKTKAKGSTVLSEVTLTEAEQIKLATKRSKKDFHVSHASGSGDGVDTQSKVPDEQQQKTSGTDEGTDTMPGVPDVPYIGIERSMKLKEEDDRCSSSSKYENSCDEDNMYLASKMKEAVDVAVQLQTNKLIEEAQAENQEFLSQVDSTMKANKSIDRLDIQKNLYITLVESYNNDNDIMSLYGDAVILKRGRHDQDKDEDPSAGSDRGTKRRKSGKDVESSIDSRLSMPQELRVRTEIMIEQPADKEVTKADWFKKLKRPPTPDPDWSKRRQIELSTLSGHGLDRHSTAQRALARVFTELEYTIFENVSPQAITERLDLDNPENKRYDKHLLSRGVDAEKIWGEVLLLEGYTRKGSLRILDKYNMTLSYFVSTHFSQNQRDLPRDIPLDSVVVLRYEKKSKSENKRSVPTEIELVQEQTQQGIPDCMQQLRREMSDVLDV